ncbi:hypothetical protein EVAR_81298_1 [Eumeta japonica]|uniref:Uncharacterized protein n=1 Tax=Eumeta variegata TaxID=151549 RepID=A0A4C1W2T9_EUMVA|nr:hypothetical protein EVAR_81298_1 [Eumeta japonica]
MDSKHTDRVPPNILCHETLKKLYSEFLGTRSRGFTNGTLDIDTVAWFQASLQNYFGRLQPVNQRTSDETRKQPPSGPVMELRLASGAAPALCVAYSRLLFDNM